MKRALVSVSDKTGIIEFCQGLISNGYEIVSTGGTLKILKEASIQVVDITTVTNFPEILDGRVKTLSPYVHGGLLYKRDKSSHLTEIEVNKIEAIDLICVNLYPFEKVSLSADLNTVIENIDIGGPSMIRSAAKNYHDVIVVTDPEDYVRVLKAIKNDDVSIELRANLCVKAFNLTARYDGIISEYLMREIGTEKCSNITLTYDLKQKLRYGENPHQNACFYGRTGGLNSVESCDVLHGKELSYNNIQDTQAALDLLAEFKDPTVCAIKHMTPCGVGIGSDVLNAWENAYNADPISIFGGIVVFNREVTKKVAVLMNEIFLEVIVAPSFEPEALEVLQTKKNVRILKLGNNNKQVLTQYKSVANGVLVQDVDNISNSDLDYTCVTKRAYTETELIQMKFAQSVVKHVKSNAIVLVADNQTVGIGSGQTSRIASAKIALEQAKNLGYGSDIILASDAFFPFDDVVTLASEYGVKAIVQPGGSIRDEDSIKKCDELGIAMAFTKYRHFKH